MNRSLEWKVRIFTVGAAFAMVGIYFDARWMTGTALVVLLGGVLLRFMPESRETTDADPAPKDAGDAGPAASDPGEAGPAPSDPGEDVES